MIRNITVEEKNSFNKLVLHPLQSWEWGEFRLKTGIEVIRFGRFEKEKLVEIAQITLHQIPFTSYRIGYLPKCGILTGEMIEELKDVGKEKNLIFIKIEPNVRKTKIFEGLKDVVSSPHPLFTKYTFQLDLTPNEDDLLKNMHPKTRYNIRLSQKKGVTVFEDNSKEAFEKYLQLLEETTVRQKFFAHTQKYHRLMWETLLPSKIAHLLLAKYKDEKGKELTLVAWIVFLFNGIIYYPYGASSNLLRQFMPSNLMMWEAIKFGKKHGAKLFDMWGALSSNPDPQDPWYGFHKFKEGYGAQHVEFAGSFDLVISSPLYRIYNALHNLRNFYLQIKAQLRK